MHRGAQSRFFPNRPPHTPLAHIPDDTGPILAIASLTPAESAQLGATTSLPVSQIAIELYTPLPGRGLRRWPIRAAERAGPAHAGLHTEDPKLAAVATRASLTVRLAVRWSLGGAMRDGRGFPALALVCLLAACGDAAGPERDRIVEGVNFTKLFAPATSAEINAILGEWAGRDPSARDVEIVRTSPVPLGSTQGTVRIVSHRVDGVRHFGAILAPAGAQPGSLPVLVVAHGGDGGVDIDETLALLPFGFSSIQDKFVFVAPSFRSEPLVFERTTYLSEGEPSPWDRDVDDALALLNVALQTTPEADPERIAVLGFSRGAAVGMLMAERDARIDVVVEFFGPTDFFGPFVQDVVTDALRGVLRDLPGLDYLNQQFIQPLKRGELTIEDVRPELLRRSPVYFANRLPQLQVHHGTADTTVPVGEAERLFEVMRDLGRGEPGFEFFLYPGGGHNLFALPGSIERSVAFLSRLLTASAVAVR
ncbi:MAG: alpha/beta fold hydrolase [Gemmatimonadetes bacterium]|nr:alpha/beta fold hydrolase [Gemmatimonadota bacterium]